MTVSIDSIYPIDIPSIEILPNLDFLLLELPPRYMPLMPNGIGYVYNILKKSGIKFQTIDANIIFYHRWHSKRILENIEAIRTPKGYLMKQDPWDTPNTNEFGYPEIIEYFWPQLEEIIDGIVRNRPKAVGISLNGDNIGLVQSFVSALRAIYPEVVIVVGGYTCIYHDIGPFIFSDFDYMVIGEAELILEPLVIALSKGERPKDIIGILSRYDSPGRVWVQPPLFRNLDSIDFPRYEWIDTSLYRTYKGEHLVPITGSRGCNWSRCNFCAERFIFRKRLPSKIADEVEFFVSKGFNTFHFNESDVNGDPQNLYDLCSEIIKRNLKVKFMGQLRINKSNTRQYFNHLAKAGFVHLRFGVDGWSEHTLRLQRKGYNMKLVFENLRDCHEAGIRTTVNIVIGVPGETDEDIDETIDNLIHCKKFIDRIESFNILNLVAGSEYYKSPHKYNIHFRGDKDEIYRGHLNFIPPELWYSDDPYIDQEVRLQRLDKLCIKLYKNGIDIGSFAQRIVNCLLESRARSSKNHDNKDIAKLEGSGKQVLVKSIGIYNRYQRYSTNKLRSLLRILRNLLLS